jgi:serine/threonine protein phosphatase PrpC
VCSCANGEFDESSAVEKVGSKIKPELPKISSAEKASAGNGMAKKHEPDIEDPSNGQFDYQPLDGEEPSDDTFEEQPGNADTVNMVASGPALAKGAIEPKQSDKKSDALGEITDGKDTPLAYVLPSALELTREASDPDAVFDGELHEFCAFGTVTPNSKGKAVIESEYNEKRLEISGAKRADEFFSGLAKQGIAISCRKAKKPDMPNQDNIFLCRMSHFTLFGVADGHGPDGHWSSHHVVRYVLRLFMADICKNGSPPGDDACVKIFELVHRAVIAQSEDANQDVRYSGSTLTVCIVDHSKKQVVVAWVGDSRAIMGSTGGDNGVGLTFDHKPNSEEEKARIEAEGGEVIQVEDDSPWRVYAKGQSAPGLAMSRSVGDAYAHSVGVSSVPHVRRYSAPNHFVVCCSDGVWEFIDNAEAARIVGETGREAFLPSRYASMDLCCFLSSSSCSSCSIRNLPNRSRFIL